MSQLIRNKLYLLTAIIIACVGLAFFNRPCPPMVALDLPQAELPGYDKCTPDAVSLADRVARSYGLAFVMIHGRFTQQNVAALEAMRSWAHHNFQKHPDFLHPVSLEISAKPPGTFMAAACHNLFAAPWYFLEGATGSFLKYRMNAFHQRFSYHTFRKTYFELFGQDPDSAILLARYQTQRAELATNTFILSAAWLVALMVSIVSVVKAKSSSEKFRKMCGLLSWGWLLLALSYLVQSWLSNQVLFLVSSIVALAAGIYLRNPFVLVKDNTLHIRYFSLSTGQVAFAIWLSFSMLTIQLLAWIRSGNPIYPDPITLLISGISGDFIHDPSNAKRYLLRAVGTIWLIISAWAAYQSKSGSIDDPELAQELESLSKSSID